MGIKKHLISLIEDSVEKVSDLEPMTKITDLATETKNSAKNVLDSLSENEFLESITDSLSDAKSKSHYLMDNLVGPVFADETIYRSFLEKMATFHTHATENPAYQKVIDGLAHTPGYGGGQFHRLVDGRHSLMGAMESLKDEFPNLPMYDRLTASLDHLWADFHSSTGIPVIAFDNMAQFNTFCETLHLPKSFVADFLTTNSTEVISSALTIIPVLFRFDEMQANEFAQVAARVGVYTAGGTQFELLGSLFSLSMLGKAIFDTHHDGESVSSIVVEATKEGGWSAGFLATTAVMPFPFSIAAAILLTGVRARIESDGIEATIESSTEIFSSTFNWIKEDGVSKLTDLIQSSVK